jgi:hypothetical protein
MAEKRDREERGFLAAKRRKKGRKKEKGRRVVRI